jgi:hypothetical protein
VSRTGEAYDARERDEHSGNYIFVVHLPQVNPSVNSREHQLKMVLGSLMSCRTPIDDRSACNVFVARGLKLCYHIGEFCIPPGNPQPLQHFELLLQLNMMAGSPKNVDVVACHVLPGTSVH